MRPTVVAVMAATTVWVAILAALWRARRWLLFYLSGSLGLVILTVVVARITTLNQALEALEARQTAFLAALLGQRITVLGMNGLAIENPYGWGIFDVGIECSGLLEMATIAGLVLFYPSVFDARKRAAFTIVGVVVTYLINLARILVIVLVVSRFGTESVFFAHAILGRIFFFIATVALYWWIVTLVTLRHVEADLRGHDS